MKVRNTTGSGRDEVELQMTPMIDIVFQLLIFFIMTFKIVVQEGDFNVKMPKASDQPPKVIDEDPIVFSIELKADSAGRLVRIITPQREIPVDPSRRGNVLAAFAGLRKDAEDFVGKDTGPDSIREKGEAKIDADEHLHYVYVIDTVTHVSGKPQGNTVIKLLKNIGFAPPKKP